MVDAKWQTKHFIQKKKSISHSIHCTLQFVVCTQQSGIKYSCARIYVDVYKRLTITIYMLLFMLLRIHCPCTFHSKWQKEISDQMQLRLSLCAINRNMNRKKNNQLIFACFRRIVLKASCHLPILHVIHLVNCTRLALTGFSDSFFFFSIPILIFFFLKFAYVRFGFTSFDQFISKLECNQHRTYSATHSLFFLLGRFSSINSSILSF